MVSCSFEQGGGSGGHRTLNRPGKNRVLCLLSYGSLVGLKGVEPPTVRVKTGCSAVELQPQVVLQRLFESFHVVSFPCDRWRLQEDEESVPDKKTALG